MAYYIVPEWGYSIHDIARKPTFDNARIDKFEHGVRVNTIPYTPINVIRFGAEPHPDLFDLGGYYDIQGRLKPLAEVIYSGYLFTGWSPFKQIPCLIVEERKAMDDEEIITYIVDNQKYADNKKRRIKYLEEMIEWLEFEGYLTRKYGKLTRNDKNRRMPVGRGRIPIKSGYNPIEYQMMENIQNQGGRSVLSNFMISNIGWIDWDPIMQWSAEEGLEHYLQRFKSEGYIREVSRGNFEVLKPLERNI